MMRNVDIEENFESGHVKLVAPELICLGEATREWVTCTVGIGQRGARAVGGKRI